LRDGGCRRKCHRGGQNAGGDDCSACGHAR
jgi:hypothetical protein